MLLQGKTLTENNILEGFLFYPRNLILLSTPFFIFLINGTRYILKNKPKNDNQVIELLDDISKDLFNHDLELRIQELESKFAEDLSETTFNELKDLKNERKTN